jgi:hypothetical protein
VLEQAETVVAAATTVRAAKKGFMSIDAASKDAGDANVMR